MRLHPLPAAPLLLALVACNAQTAGNDQGAAARGAGNEALAAPTPAAIGNEAAGLADFRAQWLEACVGGARDAAPPGTPVERHCGCAIDRVMAGKTLAELEADQQSGAYRSRFQSEMRACIREIPS